MDQVGSVHVLSDLADPVRDERLPEARLRDVSLPADLSVEEVPSQVDTDRAAGGGGLGTTEPGVVGAGRPGGKQDRAAAVDLHEGDAGVGAPPHRFEGDVAGVAEDHDPADGALRPWKLAFPAVAADPVADQQVPAGDADAEPVSVGDEHASVGGITTEDVVYRDGGHPARPGRAVGR